MSIHVVTVEVLYANPAVKHGHSYMTATRQTNGQEQILNVEVIQTSKGRLGVVIVYEAPGDGPLRDIRQLRLKRFGKIAWADVLRVEWRLRRS